MTANVCCTEHFTSPNAFPWLQGVINDAAPQSIWIGREGVNFRVGDAFSRVSMLRKDRNIYSLTKYSRREPVKVSRG